MSLENRNEQSAREGLLEIQNEKLFWKKIAEEVRETDFRIIYQEIFSDIESGNYVLARQALNEEIKKIIADKNMAMYGDTGQRDLAIIVLKEEFYKLFPEIEALIEETEGERRAKIKRPTREYGTTAQKHVEEQFYQDKEDEKWEEEKGRYLVEELEWPVPSGSELVPGLVIALSDQEAKRMEDIEFLEYPHFEDGDLFVKVKWNGEEGNIKLFNFGLAADVETGLWNSRYKPLLWEIKEKK